MTGRPDDTPRPRDDRTPSPAEGDRETTEETLRRERERRERTSRR